LSGLRFAGDSGEEVVLWMLTLLSRWSKLKFKSPCNFEELPYDALIFLPRVIDEIIDMVFIEICSIH